jgi:putative DNA primase/helicase
MQDKIQKIKDKNPILEVVGRYVKLSQRGRAIKGLCPFHAEKTPSFSVDEKKNTFNCYGCNAHGDVIDFVQKIENCTQKEALEKLGAGNLATTYEAPKLPASFYDASQQDKTPLDLVPEKLQEKKPYFPSTGNVVAVYPYHDQAGQIINYRVRFEYEKDGETKKDIRPWFPFLHNSKPRLEFRERKDKPLALYNLHLLHAHPKKTVVLVEGEKAADAATMLFPEQVVMTWQGGTGAVHKADFSVLAGRTVVIAPDWDTPGYKAAGQIAEILAPIAKKVKFSEPPTKSWNWDWADYQGDQPTAVELLRASLCDQLSDTPVNPNEKSTIAPMVEITEIPNLPGGQNSENQEPEDKEPTENAGFENEYYRALGYTSDGALRYWFLSTNTETIQHYSSAALETTAAITEIAPLPYWESGPYKQRSGLNTKGIAESLRIECRAAGYFDPTKVRGRGAWLEGKKVIIHAGDKLIVEGEPMPLSAHKSKFVYQKRQELGVTLPEPMPSPQAKKLFDIISMFAWEDNNAAKLLTGWIALAPFSGVLDWRPHIWLTGSAGTGKSWILSEVIRPALGQFHLAVQSRSTEAAIRQAVGQDALAVVYDEFETENANDYERVAAITELARSASSNNSGAIMKGSANGISSGFLVRSCFCFASIAQSMSQQSDISRITTLSLKKNNRSFEEIKQAVQELFSENWAAAFHSRMIKNMSNVLANVRTFRQAAANVLGNSRAGDQIGTMCGGYYSVMRTGKIALAEAEKWVKDNNFSDALRVSQTQTDEYRCLRMILEIDIPIGGKHSVRKRTMGQIIGFMNGEDKEDLESFGFSEITKTLERHGVDVTPLEIIVAHDNTLLKAALRNTPWANSYGKILSRLPGAVIASDYGMKNGINATVTKVDVDSYYTKSKIKT